MEKANNKLRFITTGEVVLTQTDVVNSKITEENIEATIRKIDPKKGDIIFCQPHWPQNAETLNYIFDLIGKYQNTETSIFTLVLNAGITLEQMTTEQLTEMGLQRIPKGEKNAKISNNSND